jgi:hypothetical protein
LGVELALGAEPQRFYLLEVAPTCSLLPLVLPYLCLSKELRRHSPASILCREDFFFYEVLEFNVLRKENSPVGLPQILIYLFINLGGLMVIF